MTDLGLRDFRIKGLRIKGVHFRATVEYKRKSIAYPLGRYIHMFIVFTSLYILSNGNILYCNCYQEQKKPLLEYHSKYKVFRSYLFRFKEYFIRIKAYRSRFKANQVSDSRISVHFRISDHKNEIICS